MLPLAVPGLFELLQVDMSEQLVLERPEFEQWVEQPELAWLPEQLELAPIWVFGR